MNKWEILKDELKLQIGCYEMANWAEEAELYRDILDRMKEIEEMEEEEKNERRTQMENAKSISGG